MLGFIKNWITSTSKLAGLEVRIENGETSFSGVVFQLNKGSIQGVEYLFANDLEELKQQLSKDTPIALLINGEGILHRKLESNNDNPKELLNEVLPNAVFDDFVLERSRFANDQWLAIVRKNLVEEVLTSLESADFSIVHLNVGALVSKVLIPLINGQQAIPFGDSMLEFRDEVLTKIINSGEELTESILIEEEKIKAISIPAFATAFQKAIKQKSDLINLPVIDQMQKDFFYKNLFTKIGWLGLLFFLVLLLINFMVFSRYSNRNQNLSFQINTHRQQLNLLDSLKTEFEEKQTFVSKSNLLQASKSSFFADQIGTTIRNGIVLSELEIFPKISKKNDKQIRFGESIKVKGFSANSNLLNLWIKDLEDLDWVNTVVLLPYKELNNGKGEFELELELK